MCSATTSGFWTATTTGSSAVFLITLDVLISSLILVVRNVQRLLMGQGQKQKKVCAQKVTYTTNFMVGIWRDDFNWTLSLAFTHNPEFADDSPRASEIQRMCEEYQVGRDRIYYTPSDKKYCRECNDQVRTFCERYKEVLEGAHVIHDDGNSFKYESQLIFEEYVDRVSIMPPAQHGELSTCDNNFNAIVKQRWRAERRNDEDQARDVIMLLSFCDDVEDKVIERMFNRNYLLNGERPTIERVTEFSTAAPANMTTYSQGIRRDISILSVT